MLDVKQKFMDTENSMEITRERKGIRGVVKGKRGQILGLSRIYPAISYEK